jgi:hypothetical protein
MLVRSLIGTNSNGHISRRHQAMAQPGRFAWRESPLPFGVAVKGCRKKHSTQLFFTAFLQLPTLTYLKSARRVGWSAVQCDRKGANNTPQNRSFLPPLHIYQHACGRLRISKQIL